ncbi:MAG: hypothetical protein LBC02_13285 [Planctomycetaceae bacterium]|jgi:hypothetical protein|nr:hypothetical protein [Planctomycetaceae bacterium]
MFDINVMVLGLLHVITALPCLRIRLRRDCPKTEKNFLIIFCLGVLGGKSIYTFFLQFCFFVAIFLWIGFWRDLIFVVGHFWIVLGESEPVIRVKLNLFLDRRRSLLRRVAPVDIYSTPEGLPLLLHVDSITE